MFTIDCKDIAKRFKKEVLFSRLNYSFSSGKAYAIVGHNSSGKSTLLKILAGIMPPSKGEVSFSNNKQTEECISFCSPEMHLLDDYTVQEMFDFHFSLRNSILPILEIIDIAQLGPFMNKQFSELSSGLKNKVKLSLAMFTETDALLLDEPCTNFDDKNIAWYQNTIAKYCKETLIIIASNNKEEYKFCSEELNLLEFKS
jgi:ABC-type multidrug transport system ATPase subunit